MATPRQRQLRLNADPEDESNGQFPEDPADQDDLNLIAPSHQAETTPWITLEPLVLFLFFAVYLSTSIYTNNLLYQICVYNLHEDRDVCKCLGTGNETEEIQILEVEAQKYSANIIMMTSVLTNVVPAIWGFFLGPWSDKFGRKPVMISTGIGFTLQFLITTVIAYLSAVVPINPWWYTISIVPLILTGGYTSLITVLYCYLSDITHEANRSTRMTIMSICLYLGILLGSLSSSQILNYMDAPAVFAICTGLSLISLLYIVFFIRESVVVQEGSKVRELFRINHLVDMIEAATRRRPDFCRCIVWLVISTMCLVMMVNEGSSTVFFLFVREKFGWTVHDYSLYDSMNIFVQVVGSVLGIYLLKRLFHLSDAMVATISVSSYFLDGVTKSVAQKPVHLYLATSLSLFKSVFSPMNRSIMASVAAHDEIGKLFALITALEGITPLIASPLYSTLYKATITTMPGAFNLLSAGLFFLGTLLMIIIYVLMQGLPEVTFRPISS